MSTPYEPPTRDLLLYLRALARDPRRGQFFDVRHVTPDGRMRQRFISALRIHETARHITRLAHRTDVYVGVALRDRAYGGKRAISGSHLLYIECDDPDAAERLIDFAHSPSMVVASGSPGHLHIYWRLRERANTATVESANRRLAVALKGDPASFDIARILRPPESMNHKHSPPAAVTLVAHNNTSHTLRELTNGLPEDPHNSHAPHKATAVPRQARRSALDRQLLAIPAAEYVRVLTGKEPNKADKVLCPFHTETDPSLHLYPDGTFYCFGRNCKKGGTIFDFAAAKWGLATKEDDFHELRRRLVATFAITAPSAPGDS